MGATSKTILFWPADANGVLPPPPSRHLEQCHALVPDGIYSKLAGTETGIIDPVSTFSRFFASRFMPRFRASMPRCWASGCAATEPGVNLINTGWSAVLWHRRAHGHRRHPHPGSRCARRGVGNCRIRGRPDIPHYGAAEAAPASVQSSPAQHLGRQGRVRRPRQEAGRGFQQAL